MADPTLRLHDQNGTFLVSNDDWKDSPQRPQIEASGLAPTEDKESAILQTLLPALSIRRRYVSPKNVFLLV